VAAAHSLLVIIYQLLTHLERVYVNLGATNFVQRDRKAVERRLVKRLEAPCHTINLQPAPPAA
jgi:hypothetical protein